jgi:hypothetical protein
MDRSFLERLSKCELESRYPVGRLTQTGDIHGHFSSKIDELFRFQNTGTTSI